MMRRPGAALMTGTLLIAPLTIASPAAADTPGCVTKAEFKTVKKGWGMARVHRVFDTKGKQVLFISGTEYFPAMQSREYKACKKPKWSWVSVDFQKKPGRPWRLTGKSAYWG